jgi:hypothetical protein
MPVMLELERQKTAAEVVHRSIEGFVGRES